MPSGNPFLEIAYEKVELVCKKWNSKKSTVNYLLLIKRYLYKKSIIVYIFFFIFPKKIRNIR
jgi:hypothetical protein